MAIDSKFNKTFTLKRPTLSKDAGGSTTRSLTTVTTFSGRMRQLKAQEQVQYGKDSAISTHRLYCIQSVRVDDVVVYDSQNYNILSIDDPHLKGQFYQVDMELKI